MKRIAERNKIENMAQYPLTVKCRSCPKAGRGDIDICDDCLNAIYHRLADIEEILGDDYDLDRLRELVEADRNGRCVVLPVKPHDNAFVIHSGVIEACTVEGVYFTGIKNYVRLRPIIQSYVGNRSLFYTPLLSSYGKVFFRNREAAEAALKQNNE